MVSLKRQPTRPGGGALLAGLIVALTGCATPPPAAAPQPTVILSARYDVEPIWVGRSRAEALSLMGRDFETLDELGFESVHLYWVDPPDREAIESLASGLGLRCELQGPSANGQQAILYAPLSAGDGEGSLSESLLDQVHRALVAGRTGGILLDRYRNVPGEAFGLLGSGQVVGPSVKTALQRAFDRYQHWSPRLVGLERESLDRGAPVSENISVTAFVGPRQRYVLVHNSDRNAYCRTTLQVPAVIGQRAVARLVEVPPTGSTIPGDVYRAGPDGVSVPIELRPGDAVLFEVF